MPWPKLFSRKEKKQASKAPAPKGPANEMGIIKVEKVSTRPPSYWQLGFDYRALDEEAKAILSSKATHTKKEKYEELLKRKTKLDETYGKYAETPVSMSDLLSDNEFMDDKEKAEKSKGDAETSMKALEKKVPKNVQNHESLEKHKNTALVNVIKHASDLKKDDDTLAKDPSAETDQAKQTEIAKQKTEVKNKRKKAKDKYEKKDKRDDKMEKAGFVNTILQYIGSVFGAVSDGIGNLADLGVEAKESADALRKGKTSWSDAMKEPWEKGSEAADKVGAGFSYGAAGLALLSAVYSAVELGRSVVQVFKRNKNHTVDSQERWADARMVLGNICDVFSNVIGAISPFTSALPLVGSILNITDNGIQLLLGTMNLANSSAHAVMMRNDKKAIWKKIEAKRNKYKGTEDAQLFDITAFDGNGAAESVKRKQKDSDIDLKRRNLLKKVAEQEGIEKQALPSSGKRSEDARNFSIYRGAEANISTRISKLREERHQKEAAGSMTDKDRAEYKKRMHAMEALELMSQYRAAEKSAKKMHKSLGHDIEGLITNGFKLAANVTTLIGEVTAATGYGASLIAVGTAMNIAEGGYEMARGATSKIYEWGRNAYGSTANKENTREELGQYLFDKMISVGPEYGKWSGDFFDLSEAVPDYKIKEENNSMEELYSIVRRGLDTRVSVLMAAPTSKTMKKALASAFSQEGGVSFAQDGV